LENKQLPNIIFLDGVPSQKYGGITQTLYNLFDSYPQDKLYAFVNDYQKSIVDESFLKCKQIALNEKRLSHLRKRIISKLNPFITKLNGVIRDVIGVKVDKKALPENGFLLVCTTDPDKLHAAKIIHKKYKYPMLTYFMDDWVADLKLSWGTGNIDELVKYTLDEAAGRLMISEMLNKSLIERYSAVEKPTYVVHNPVALTSEFSKPKDVATLDKIKIIYAGSIWSMHLDALALVASAVETLNQGSGFKYELCIYSDSSFWERNKAQLDKPGVTFGGFVMYNDLAEKLSVGTLLLVTSSFLKEFEAFSRSSVQTKLTDYMRIGLPVLSVGPTYGACNWFVNKWQCGYVYDSTDLNGLVKFLKEIPADNATYQLYASNAYSVVKEHFSKPVIQKQLNEFITSLPNN